MKLAVTILAVLLGLLSIVAGAAKIALVPDEVVFLSQFGFTPVLTVSFGIVQALSGVVLIIPATRLAGALVAASAFALSAALLWAAGNTVLALTSLIPVVLVGCVALQSFTTRRVAASGDADM